MRLKKSRLIAAAMSALLLVSVIPFNTATADEGMFMLDKVATLPLAQKGLKMSANDIYNPANGGISEAVVRLSIGCTGEFVSPDGLILTNHHCGYDALVAASTPEANYGEVGFKADDRSKEIKAEGYSIRITQRQEDVTAEVLNGVTATGAERDAAVKNRITELQNAEKSKLGADQIVEIQSLSAGMYYYKFVYQTIRDIRVVYAPPKAIGFYGGDPDNFEWTRHCGDFTFLRAYVAPDGKAAEYSANNVPFKPRRFLTINTDGIKENDFTMVIGYPGGTTRYRESYSIEYNQNYALPFTVDSLTAQVEALEAVGRADNAKRVKLQADVFSLYNSIKATSGGVVAMRRANIVAQRRAEETKFQQWANFDPTRKAKYGDALPALKAAYDEYSKTAPRDLLLRSFANLASTGFVAAIASGQATKEDLRGAIPEIISGDPEAGRATMKFLLRRAAELPANQRIAAIEKQFGSFQGDARIRAEDEFARRASEDARFTTEKGLNDLISMTPAQIRESNDPLFVFINGVSGEIPSSFENQSKLSATVNRYRLPFMQGMAEMRGTSPYPDANFTQRFTYGSVKGYSPKESIVYTPFTTLNGIFEKETGRDPFLSPARLIELFNRKDYGIWNVNGTVPVNFLSTDDIIGGNSGSPIMNARGEQVGLVFDGNYEGLGNDFFFNPNLGRTISVDIRYVLFLTDKFGGAGWILKEMKLTGSKAKAATARS